MARVSYSPASVIKWIGASRRAYYSSQFRAVFDRTIESAWADWVNFERTFQQANLDAIRKYPVTPATDVSPRSLGSVSRAYYDSATKRIYAALNYPGAVAHVAAISLESGDSAPRWHERPPIYQSPR
jgi:hypothetical protein